MLDIKKRIDKIFEKYPDYTSFTYTKSTDSRTGKVAEQWNIYTPVLNHNRFTERDKFIQFLDMIVNVEPQAYKEARLERLKDRRIGMQEDLEMLEDEIKHFTVEVEAAGKHNINLSSQKGVMK